MRHLTRLFRALLLLITPLSAVQAQEAVFPPRPSKSELRVVSWNLLNLFDNQDDPYHADEGTSPKAQASIRRLAAVVDALNPDILGVQEVENREVLESLNRQLARPFAYVELVEGNDKRGIDTGLLSRFPIEAVTSHRQRRLGGVHGFARDFPLFSVRVCEELLIDVGVVHFKSRRGETSASDAWRKAEATAARDILVTRRRLDPKRAAIVMGDFNDSRDAATVRPLFQYLKDPTATLVPEEKRFSYTYRGRGEQIDFILHSSDLEAKRATIHHPAANPSDHYPVIVDFAMPSQLTRVAVERAGSDAVETKVPQFGVADLAGLRRHLLKEVRATGKVVAVYRTRDGGWAALNFAEDYRKTVSAWIPAALFDRLPDLDALVGKKVSFQGPLHDRRGSLRITISEPGQLRHDG